MNPVVVHVLRPFSNEQDYLAAEAWSIDARGMLLIDAEALAPNTAVVFDVALSDGQRPIRAEGRVVGVVAASSEHPGGLRVRFKRFGAATKAFVERAVKLKASADEPAQAGQPLPELPSAPEAEPPSEPRAEQPSVDEEPASAPEVDEDGLVRRVSTTDATARELNGLRGRVPGPVSSPANRDELLARLRRRGRTA